MGDVPRRVTSTAYPNVSPEWGEIEVAQQMAGHSNAKTTGLYDRRNDAVELDEVETVV